MVGPDRIPIPALLATAAVHHHLIRKGLRTSVGLVVETGEPREVHHFALPRRLWRRGDQPLSRLRDACRACASEFPEEVDEDEVVKRYIKSIGKGILKVMSKMGISTYQSYCGAQIFDAVGLASSFVDELLLRHRDHDRRRRPGRDRRGDGAPPPRRLRRRAGLPQRARRRRRIRLPHARRGACLDAGDGVAAAACGARQSRRTSIAPIAKLLNEQAEQLLDHPRPVPHQDGRGGRRARRCRSRRSSRQPTSSSASRPAPCPSARSPARRIRRSRSP